MNMEKNGVMRMMICIVVVGLVFVPSTTFAISSERALIKNDQVNNGPDGKMVAIIDRDTLLEVLLKERLSQDNQCLGKGCAPWSPCQPGCHCVEVAAGIGACI
ncbi:hypothetical protein CsatA_024310 [Cannabis sativa]